MATIQNKSTVQNTQDFITIQDLFYLCLDKWHWFAISLALCLGVATFYLLRTPSVYVRTASILIKDDSKGKSSSTDMESFSDLGLFTTNTNVYNEMGTLKSPDIMREVVSRLHLEMNYQTDGRFHKQTVYGNQLPVQVVIPNLSENESATFELHLAKDGAVELSSFTRNGTEIENDGFVKGNLNDSIQSPLGPIVVIPSAAYSDKTVSTIYVTRQSLSAASAGCSARLNISQNDEKSNIITLSFQDVSTQRAEDVLNTLISVYNENWVRDKNQIAVSTSMFINERLGVIEGELGNVDDDISSFKSEHLLPDVQAAANMYMTQANEANAAIRELNNQAYMARYIKNYLTNENNKHQLLPANSGIENASLATQLNEYNTKLLERNSLVSHSSAKNPLVREMDKSLDDMRSALITSIDNQMVALRAQIRSLEAIGGQATSQIASNPKQSKYLLSVERQQKVKESLYLYLSSQFLITINLKEESMENNKPANNEIQIELSEEMAQGTYANLAIISHSSSEFILDFIRVVPGAPKAQVKSRVILTPDNAQRLLFALQDNIKKFGEQLQAGNNNNKTANFEDFAGPTGEA